MNKGKFGISLSLIAAVSFVLAALNQTLALVLIVGFSFLLEKDLWLKRQTLQALLLCLTYNVIGIIRNIFFDIFYEIFDKTEAYKASILFSDINSMLSDLIYIAFIVFCVIALVNVLKAKDANLPVLSKIADKNIADE